MNILMIYAHNPLQGWSTPDGIRNELESRGCNVKICNLFNSELQYSDAELRFWLGGAIKEFDPEIVLHMDYGQFHHQLLNKYQYPDACWIMEAGDDPQQFHGNSLKAADFDHVLTPHFPCVSLYDYIPNIKAHWWTHHADTRMYYPIDDAPIEYDVVTSCGYRGEEFEKIEQYFGNRMCNRTDLLGIKHTCFLNSGRFIIQKSRHGEVTRRIFEGLACGKIVFTDRIPGDTKIYELFPDHKDSPIQYYSSAEEAIDKIEQMLVRNYAPIADRGLTKCLLNHTQEQRVDHILHLVNV